jgi:hypothetical protein
MDRRWPVISEDTEARGMLLAPWGFNSPLSPSPSPSPRLPGFVEFGDATFRARASEAERPGHATGLLGSLICRPMVFRCSDVAWIAASASRASRRFSGRGRVAALPCHLPRLATCGPDPSAVPTFGRIIPSVRYRRAVKAAVVCADHCDRGDH